MSTLLVENGLVYKNGKFVKGNLLVENGHILDEISADVSEVVDATDSYVIPGFIDIHTHGAVNVDVNHIDVEGFVKISEFFASQGTTAWLCSIVTDERERVEEIIYEYLAYKNLGKQVGAECVGLHLEGPFLAHEYRGSMPEHLLVEMDIDWVAEMQELAEGHIKYITVAPEVAGVNESISKLLDLGIQVSIGHSGATYIETMAAIEAGATVSTHTFNAMRLLHQHEPAILGAILETDVYAEAIIDGFHLHPGTVRLLIKTKGLDRVIAITDSIMAAGLGDGEYQLGVNDVIVKDGDARLKHEDVRAGSTLTMIKSLQNVLKFTDYSLAEVLPMYTENPAKAVGIFDERGSLDSGKQADFVVLDQSLMIQKVYVGGQRAFEAK